MTTIKDLQIGQTFYMTNTVDAVGTLEDSGSTDALRHHIIDLCMVSGVTRNARETEAYLVNVNYLDWSTRETYHGRSFMGINLSQVVYLSEKEAVREFLVLLYEEEDAIGKLRNKIYEELL